MRDNFPCSLRESPKRFDSASAREQHNLHTEAGLQTAIMIQALHYGKNGYKECSEKHNCHYSKHDTKFKDSEDNQKLPARPSVEGRLNTVKRVKVKKVN
jgi:hypothetical protein